MGAVFERLRSLYELHRRAAGRAIVAVLAVAGGLVVIGGAIRLLEPPERATATPATSATPSPEWSADLGAEVTGLAVGDDDLFATGDQLTVFPLRCVAEGGRCAPLWRGVVPDGPLSVPVVRDERVFVGSSEGQVYAFPASCDGEGCPPEWVGVAGEGVVSEPVANFDLVYVVSDALYAFPVACATDDVACPPAWTAELPGRAAAGPPALGEGLVIVASSSPRGGIAAFPSVCNDDCEPAWTGRTNGPATSVAIGDGFAFTVARGQLLAFPLGCPARCEPAWRARIAPGASAEPATGRPTTSAPTLAGSRVLVGDGRGRLWVYRTACETARCAPIATYVVAETPLHSPAVDGERVVVTSQDGVVARVLLDCRDGEDCEPLILRPLGAPAVTAAVIGPEATIAGTGAGSVEAFSW